MVDKFFQGIQFAMAKALIKNGVSYKGKIIKKFDQFKSIYGEELSEKGIFYSIMDYIFQAKKYTTLKGEASKGVLRQGEPDYYSREAEKVFLIEYKDVIINASVKHSYNFDMIMTEVFKKLVDNQSGSPKGLMQLVNSVEEIML